MLNVGFNVFRYLDENTPKNRQKQPKIPRVMRPLHGSDRFLVALKLLFSASVDAVFD